MLAAVGGSPMSKAEGNIIEESIARLGKRLSRDEQAVANKLDC